MTNKKKDKKNSKFEDKGLSVDEFNKGLSVLLNTKPIREEKEDKKDNQK